MDMSQRRIDDFTHSRGGKSTSFFCLNKNNTEEEGDPPKHIGKMRAPPPPPTAYAPASTQSFLYTHIFLVMLLLVLKIVRVAIVAISTPSFCFREGRGDLCPFFKHNDDTKLLPLPEATFALRSNADCDISSFLGVLYFYLRPPPPPQPSL